MDTKFRQFSRKWTSDVATINDQDKRISYFKEQLPLLLLDTGTVRSILKHMAQGRRWPDLRRSGLFKHEVLLYLDPARRFSVRMYFHPPRSYTDIHDHTSWGVSGTAFGKLSVISYAHNGKIKKGRVQLQIKDQRILSPGEIELTQPWDHGIHKTGSADGRLNVMVSIYGPPGRRLYVNRYDEKTGEVVRLYPPRLLRRNMAKADLKSYE